jgi:hypothetical protein
MTEDSKRWADTATSPVADIKAEAERLLGKPLRIAAGPPEAVRFRATPCERIVIERSPAQLGVEGCRCGCSDGRRVR